MSKYSRPYRKRLSIDIPTTLFDKIKEISKERTITITRYVISAIIVKMKLEEPHEPTK